MRTGDRARALEPKTNPNPLELRADWHYEQDGPQQHYVVEAWVDDELAGRAHGWLEAGGRFVIVKIELDRAHRSQGYGSALIELLRAKAREKNCRELVFQGVRAANRRAIKLYESLGAVAQRTSDDLYAFVIAPP
jgi:ribosomal protein S18 acetylase RimI-like enzyme